MNKLLESCSNLESGKKNKNPHNPDNTYYADKAEDILSPSKDFNTTLDVLK